MKNKSNQSKIISLYLGIFFTSLSAIVFEISLTKIFSVTLWYHFAYFAVSLALFGLGAGGIATYFWQSFLSKHFPNVLKHLVSLQFLSMILSLLFILNLPNSVNLLLRLSLIYIICSIPFFLTGMILSLVIHKYVKNTPRIYFSDLFGSGIGCIVFVLAITIFSGPTVVIIGAFLALVASIFFYESENRLKLIVRICIVISIFMGLSFINSETNIFTVKYTKKYIEREDMIYEKWSPLARITVYPTVFFQENPDNPFGWGMSKKFNPKEPIEQLWIEQDASAGTPITHFTGDISKLDFLKYDISTFVYHVKPKSENALIIGCGGGRDVLTALYFGVSDIKACDINPVIINLVKERYREFAGDIYSLPQVDVEIAEGRNYIRNQDQNFDIVQISLIDSWAATVAGAFSLAENNLYTVEAFEEYIEKLNKNGILSITRYLFQPRNQSLRVAIIARKALELYGVEHAEQNIAVISSEKDQGLASILIKKTPFTQKEIEKIRTASQDLCFEIIYLPGYDGDQEFSNALTTESLDTYLADTYYDLHPSTDNKPFFFQMMYFSRAFDLIFKRDIVGQKFNYYAPLVLITLLVLSSSLVCIFYFLPLILSKKARGLPKSWGFYFIFLGLGFMFIEIPLLQKGSLYLGHPTLSFSVVLFSMLFFAGYGSYWSRRLRETNLLTTLRTFLVLTLVAIGIVIIGSEWLIKQTIGLSLMIKIPLFILLIGLAAFFMGIAFPTGIRLISFENRNSIPWIWALNGGASVMGSVLSMIVAMNSGYMITFLFGGICYLTALIVTFHQRKDLRFHNE